MSAYRSLAETYERTDTGLAAALLLSWWQRTRRTITRRLPPEERQPGVRHRPRMAPGMKRRKRRQARLRRIR